MLQGCLLSVKFHQLGKGVNGRDRPKRWRWNRLPSRESGLLLKRRRNASHERWWQSRAPLPRVGVMTSEELTIVACFYFILLLFFLNTDSQSSDRFAIRFEGKHKEVWQLTETWWPPNSVNVLILQMTTDWPVAEAYAYTIFQTIPQPTIRQICMCTQYSASPSGSPSV